MIVTQRLKKKRLDLVALHLRSNVNYPVFHSHYLEAKKKSQREEEEKQVLREKIEAQEKIIDDLNKK